MEPIRIETLDDVVALLDLLAEVLADRPTHALGEGRLTET